MSQVFSILIIVGGGLGTFLLGMKHLSEGLQAVSRSGLRRFMSLATSHRLAGVGTGVITTVIVQSSSIITVMVVGFVSSGLMNLSQAINVIIGSNIGTTATAWLIAFAPDVKMLGLCVVLVGAAFYFFQRNERLHNLGLAFMGLGCIFMGLYWMKEGMEPVSDEAAAILKATRRLRKGGQNFSEQSCQTLLGIHEIVFSLAETVSGLIKSPRPRFDLAALQANSHDIGRRIHDARRNQLDRVGPDDPDSPVRVLAELDILNAYERIRSCYINMAETLAGRK